MDSYASKYFKEKLYKGQTEYSLKRNNAQNSIALHLYPITQPIEYYTIYKCCMGKEVSKITTRNQYYKQLF